LKRVFSVLILFCAFGVISAYALQPVITWVTIPNTSMKIGDVVTATISVQSDSATTYTLGAGSDIGGYPLGSLTKLNSTTYEATFTITEGGTDYAAGEDIPVDLTLEDPGTGLTGSYTTPISQDSDPIDANRPAKPAAPDLADASDNGSSDSDDITDENTPTFQGAAGAVEGNSTVTVYSSIDGSLGTTAADADGSWSFTVSASMSDGTHDVTVTATDAAGNTSVESDALSVLIDTQDPPSPDGRDPADGTYTNDNTPTFSWDPVTDPGDSGVRDYHIIVYDSSHVQVKSSYPSNTQYTPHDLPDGTYTWKVATRDVAGNTGDWSTELTFTVDTVKPTVTAVSPTSLADVDAGVVTITVTFDEDMNTSVNPTVTVEDLASSYSTNNPSWTDARHFTCTFMFNDENEEATGHYHISGAQDLAGNTMDDDNTHSVDVDTKNPTITSIVSATADGYYKAGDDVDVTVNFSEPVTLTGGTLDIDLDSGPTVSIGPFGPATSGSTTYTVSAGENSCDLDATGVALNGGTLRDAAGNDASVALPATTIADGSDITVDTTAPVISDLTVSDEAVDDNCEATVMFSATVTDNCCIDAGNVIVNVTLPTGNATLGTPTITKTQFSTNQVDISGSVPVSDLNGCPATVQVTVDATDCCGNSASDVQTGNVIDTTAPVISNLTVSDETVDDNCEATVMFSATVTDNCCIDADSVVVNVTLPTGNATLGTPTITKTQFSTNQVDISGSVLVSDLNGCPATVQVTVDATDCCGNIGIQASETGNVTDTTAPTISWDTPLPPSPQYVDPTDCSIIIPIDAMVSDNCCISAANVTKSITVTNATVTDTVAVTQVDENHVRIAGNITVSALTGCPAALTVAINATDCCGNADAWTASVNIYDQTIPVISNLVVADHVLVSPDCCETVVPFAFDVTDSCCITPAGITITATNPTDNLILDFDQARDVVFTQISQGHVGIAGIVHVRCLTSCPARVEVYIEAVDCCGNAAVAVTSTDTEGRVYDETPPTAMDDPNGDEDRSSSDGLEVRVDDYGQYRLMVRQNTPVRIDPIANDTDNCSACTCCGTMWIYEIVDFPQYGTVTVETDHGDCHGGSILRYAPYRDYLGPDRFTYRVVDACGNVSNVATVYLETVRQTVMKDLYLSGCKGETVGFEVTATDLWIDPDDPETIPFMFTVVSPPAHGILLGDPDDVTYTPHGRTTKQIESASIMLTYVPAEGFTGHDTAHVRFSDPFGGSSTALVDVMVIDCEPAKPAAIVLHRGEELPIFVPVAFTTAYGAGEAEWTVTGPNGPYSGAISPVWDEGLGAYVLLFDTGGLEVGEYEVTVPTGAGETEAASFTAEVIE